MLITMIDIQIEAEQDMLRTMIDIQIETEQKLMFQDKIYFCDPEGGNESQALIHGFPSLRRIEGDIC